MNSQEGSKLKLQLAVSILVFIVVIALGYVFRKILQETLLVSIQYGLWWGAFFIKVFGQHFLWGLILVVTLGLAFQLSRVRILFPKKKDMTMDEIKAPVSRRIDFWMFRIYRYRKVRNGNNYFLLEFPKLIIDTLAFHERKDPDRIKDGIINGTLSVPAEVRRIVGMEDFPRASDKNVKAFQKVRDLIRQIQGRFETPIVSSDSDLEKVAAYLENLLEDENVV